MKRIFFVAVLLIFVSFSMTASAAGPAYNWTGFYAGLQGSYADGETDWQWTNLGRADHDIDGWMGGIFLGYNYQFPINLVVGIEIDISAGKIEGSTLCPNPSWEATSTVNWYGTTRARLGYAVYRFLPYVAAGVVYGNADISVRRFADDFEATASDTYIGWTPSIGLEYAITNNLIIRAEYAYYDFGEKRVQPLATDYPIDVHTTFDSYKIGLSWKF